MIEVTGTPDVTINDLAELALDPVSGDIAFPPYILTGPLCVIQRIRVRFRFFLGEWFLDQRLGIPYFQDILIKNPDPTLISAIFRQVLLTTPGVLRVDAFTATLDAPTRVLTVNFQATLTDGSTIITAQAEPFIIST